MPFRSSKGFIREEFSPHGYGSVTLIDTLAAVETLRFRALISV